MVRSVFPLLLLYSLYSVAQIPNYFENNPLWYCSFWDSDQWNTPAEPFTDEYIYYLNGDTTALGFTYHKVFKKGYRNFENTPQQMDVMFDEQTAYYIRQEGRSIRFFTASNNADSLLVSYDYAVGDTVSGYIFTGCHLNDTIQKIDSVLINTEYRRLLYLDTLNGPVITEGIGHQNQLGGSGGELLEMLCTGTGFDYYIHCYGQNNNPLWDAEGNGGDCFLNVSVSVNSIPEYKIYPNPVTNQFSVISSVSGPLVISLVDIYGNTILTTTEKTVNTEPLVSGIYILVLTDHGGNRIRKEIIKL
ncbi:MAG: T9SS type A sorting domain-containing protein [Bacteroidetes bacterium]|nr:T9SS type A sorting domain-containing protein [Bacteroidota bacterium]